MWNIRYVGQEYKETPQRAQWSACFRGKGAAKWYCWVGQWYVPVGCQYKPPLYLAPMTHGVPHWHQELRATISSVVVSRYTRLDSFVVKHCSFSLDDEFEGRFRITSVLYYCAFIP